MSSPVPALLRGLVDDAAVFPPGNATMPDAVARHAGHRASSYADAVGPLLLPADGVAELGAVLDTDRWPGDRPLRIGLVSRPGADPTVLADATTALAEDGRVEVVGAELGWYEGWYDDLAGDLPLAVELPRGADLDRAFAEVRSAHREGLRVIAKFRTGPTPSWPWPDERELGDVIRLLAPEVPFKLTGGLHHAVRGVYEVDGTPEHNHGLLNVLVATASALEHASATEVAGLLAATDAQALAALVAAWTDTTVGAVRTAFTSYGCCTVTDPLGELADLGLLPHPTEGPV
ncbi:MAG: hypothetical protein ACRCSN_05100 [Dermatophilaceae bacterium]